MDATAPATRDFWGKVFEHLTLREVATKRGVCRFFKDVAEAHLRARRRVDTAPPRPPGAFLARYCRGLRVLRVGEVRGLNSSLVVEELASSCHDLRVVDLTGCDCVGDVGCVALAAHCAHLEELNLSGTAITVRTIERLADRSARGLGLLRDLRLGGVLRLANDQPLARLLARCCNLRHLDLLRCAAVGDGTVEVVCRNCALLHTLVLNGCKRVGDHGAQHLGLLPPDSLTHLDLGWTAVTDAGVAHALAGRTCLRTLNLQATRLTDHSVGAIVARCPQLRWLDLGYTALGDDGMHELLRRCPSTLCELRLSHCSNLVHCGLGVPGANNANANANANEINNGDGDDDGDGANADHHQQAPWGLGIQLLDVSSCDNLSDDATTRLVQRCPELRDVNLAWCAHVSDRTLAAIGAGLHRLRSLSVEMCEEVTDEGFQALARCRELASLNAEGCYNLSDEAVQAVSCAGGVLRSLNLCGCDDVTDQALELLRRRCRALQFLNIRFCCQITPQATAQFVADLPKCKLLT